MTETKKTVDVSSESSRIANSYLTTIKSRFPTLLSSFFNLSDPRKKKGKQYHIAELMMGALLLFLLKEGSRNQLNNNRNDGYFMENYNKLFGMKLPHMDTPNGILCVMASVILDKLKMDLMSLLFEQKWLRNYRLLNKYYLVVVDATGVVSFNHRHCEHCLTKTNSKTGEITYFHYVLEAKLVTKDGHCFSLASEWIENPVGEYRKQDCERKAFLRLAAKLKRQYPRLPICILADGLYPYENAFKTCEENEWKFIFVLKNDSLKTVQEELTLTRLSKPVKESCTVKQGWRITDQYRFQNDIEYHKNYKLNWMQCVETRKKDADSMADSKTGKSCFEYVTNITPDIENIRELCTDGRLRWKIENEGFNTQKNNGYELEHKYSETSYTALQHYYSLLQIAHAINQLVEKGKCVTEIKKCRPKETTCNLWEKLRGFLIQTMPVLLLSETFNQLEIDIEGDLEPAPT